MVERTGDEHGDDLRSKKGDFVVSIDPSLTRGVDLRIVVEAKNRSVPVRRFAQELAEARRNRRAAVAMAVFTPDAAPTGIAPVALRELDVYCVLDPDSDGPDAEGAGIALVSAYRLARALALASLRNAPVQVNVPAVQAALAEITRGIGEVQGMKSSLTSIANTAGDISTRLNAMRLRILGSVKEVERQLDVVSKDAPSPARTA